MDPNTNLEPETPGLNPAADVANAALAGATPVVTTTDLNANDVAPETALQTPALEAPAPEALAAPAPTLETPTVGAQVAEPVSNGSVTITPSADFQMGEVATVSAVQNGADANLAAAANDILVGTPLEPQTPAENPMDNPAVDQLANTDMGQETQTGQEATDFNDPNALAAAEAKENEKAEEEEEEDDEPLVAAAPVPGSIGSAKSYSDIQRAEAEKAAKVAAKQEKTAKNTKNIIMISAIGVIALIGIIVGALVIFGGNSAKPTPTVTYTSYDENDDEYSTLSCKRVLAIEEYSSYGAVSGTQENIFYFRNDVLDGLVTNFAYTYANQALSEIARDNFMRDYGVTVAGAPKERGASEIDEPNTSETEKSTEKTTADMLHHYVWLTDYTVTHGMEIESIDINAWLESDAYSDKTYGATADGAQAPLMEGETEADVEQTESGEVVRNLKYYNRLQNSINYDCKITKGY